MLYNIDGTHLYNEYIHDFEFLNSFVAKPIRDVFTQKTEFVMVIAPLDIRLYSVSFEMDPANQHLAPTVLLNTTIHIEELALLSNKLARINDAYLVQKDYLFIDYTDHLGQGESDQRYLGVLKCQYFFGSLKCQLVGNFKYPSQNVVVKIDYASKSFFVVDSSPQGQSVYIFNINEDTFLNDKLFLPSRIIQFSSWGISNSKICNSTDIQKSVISTTDQGVFEVLFQNPDDGTVSIALFSSNFSSIVSRFYQTSIQSQAISLASGASSGLRFLAFFERQKSNTMNLNLLYPSISF